LLLCFWCSKNICKLLVCLSNNKKLLNLVEEWKNIKKCLMILSYKCKIATNLSTNVTITPNAKFMLRKTKFSTFTLNFLINIKS
jgi:hypothetical protein